MLSSKSRSIRWQLERLVVVNRSGLLRDLRPRVGGADQGVPPPGPRVLREALRRAQQAGGDLRRRGGLST